MSLNYVYPLVDEYARTLLRPTPRRIFVSMSASGRAETFGVDGSVDFCRNRRESEQSWQALSFRVAEGMGVHICGRFHSKSHRSTTIGYVMLIRTVLLSYRRVKET